MANITVDRQFTFPRVGSVFGIVRRYPIFPAVVLLVVLIIPSAFAGLIAPHDPLKQNLFNRLAPPAWMGISLNTKTVVQRVENPEDRETQIPLASAKQLTQGTGEGQVPNLKEDIAIGDEIQIVDRIGGDWSYPFGTDGLGRDLLSRTIHGARISLIISLIVISCSGAIGVALGLMAGFYGGWFDYVISRLIDMVIALPAILVALVLVVVFEPGIIILISVIVGSLWSQYARLVRGEALSLTQQDFVAKARVAGCSNIRIMARYILPNIFNSLVVLATLQVGYVIIIESSLSFLGLGIPPPEPTWGNIVSDGRDLIIRTAWWVSLFPGLAIVLTVLSMNLIGDWLRDTLDPRLRQV